jgi:putative spermidine/putrescine transport system permease protein
LSAGWIQALRRLWQTPGLLLAAPAVLLIAGLFALPVFRLLVLGFTDPQPGLGNYAMLVTNDTIHRIAVTTLWVCGITTACTVLLGYVVAYAMVHATRPALRLMVFCILLIFWLSVLVRTFAWVLLLRNNGLVNEILLASGLITQPLTLVRNQFGSILGMVHVMMPFAILPLYSALQGIDQRVVAAARGLGCGPMRSFLWVFLPLSRPGIIAATVLVFIFSLGFFITPAILGGGKVVMIAEFIRAQFERSLRWGFASMLATTLLAAVLLALGVASRFVDLRGVVGRR